MLTFAEEIFLLALDDVTGKVSLPGGKEALNRALAGAVLCELSFLNKIDTDKNYLHVIDTSATGMQVLDEILDILMMKSGKESVHYWLERLLHEAGRIKELVIEELLEKEIIKEDSSRFLWVFPSRRYPLIDNEEVQDVETRLRTIVLGTEIPSPRESALISIVYACDIFSQILSPKEFHRTHDRIKTLANLDMFGKEVIRLVNEMAIVTGVMPPEN